MEKKELQLTLPEAAFALCSMVSLSDNDASKEEAMVLRKYYRYDTGDSLNTKLTNAGYSYPSDISDAENDILTAFDDADRNFKLRTIATALLLARADGVVVQEEMNLLNKFAEKFEVSLAEADEYATKALKEIDERGDYHDADDWTEDFADLHFTLEEAAVALSALVAFSDDDPSEPELGIIREFFSYEAAESVIKKMKETDFVYPDELAKVQPAIISTFEKTDRQNLIWALAIVYKVAIADGKLLPEELEILKEYCEMFMVGLSELKNYFRS